MTELTITIFVLSFISVSVFSARKTYLLAQLDYLVHIALIDNDFSVKAKSAFNKRVFVANKNGREFLIFVGSEDVKKEEAEL